MATLTKYASSHTAITGGYTNPTNAYSDNGVYATAAPARSGQVSAYFGFPAFSAGDIPDNSAINSVKVEIQFKVSTQASIASQYAQVFVNTSGVGAEQGNTAEPLADTLLSHTATSGVTLSNLRSAGVVRCRCRSVRGNSGTAVTFSIDYASITVDYTVPTPISAYPEGAAATAAANAPTTGLGGSAELSGADATAAAGDTSIALALGVVPTGAQAAGAAGDMAISNTLGGVGLMLPWSLNLVGGGIGGEIAYKYASDTHTPTFTEDAVDTVTLTTYGDLDVSWGEATDIALRIGVSTSIPPAFSTSAAGTPTVRAKANVTLTSLFSNSSVNTPFQIRLAANITPASVVSVAVAGAVFTETEAETQAGAVGVSSAGSAGGITGVRGFASTSVVGAESATAAGGVSAAPIANAPVAGVGSAGSAGTLTVAAIGSVTLTLVSNSSAARVGVLRSDIGIAFGNKRRIRPKRGERTIYVAR